MLIYCLEDDSKIGYIIAKTLEKSGYSYQQFNRSEDLIRQMEIKMPDMFLLDMMMPDMSGLEVLKHIRKYYKSVPVMMVSALGSEMDKVQALDLGADDYLTKPFGILELTSRINAHLRKVEKQNIHQKDDIKIDVEQHKCYINDMEVRLTNKEFDILLILVMQQGRVVTKEQLFNEVWQMEADIETRTLDMHIKSLRQKISHSQVKILTVRGVGYQL